MHLSLKEPPPPAKDGPVQMGNSFELLELKVSKYNTYVSIFKILKKDQLKKNLSSLQNFIPFQNVLEALYNKCKEFYLLMRAKWVIPCFVVVF